METKVSFRGNERKGYRVEDEVILHTYGHLKENADGNWEVRNRHDDRFLLTDPISSRNEAAEFLINHNPIWPWDGGRTCLSVAFTGEVFDKHPEYGKRVQERCNELRRKELLAREDVADALDTVRNSIREHTNSAEFHTKKGNREETIERHLGAVTFYEEILDTLENRV